MRIAKVEQEYAGRRLQVGEAFEPEPQHVPLLLALGRIEPMDGDPVDVTRDMTVETSGNYLTRDLTPERTKRPYRRKAGTQ